MKAVLQRVKKASVKVDGEVIASIGKGVIVLLGVKNDDTEKEADYIAKKTANLRIFEDKDGKMNLSNLDVGGEFMVVSQFTLYGDCKKGRRPSYTSVALPEKAEKLHDYFVKKLKEYNVKVQTGKFGAKMLVSIDNDGPVTLIVEN